MKRMKTILLSLFLALVGCQNINKKDVEPTYEKIYSSKSIELFLISYPKRDENIHPNDQQAFQMNIKSTEFVDEYSINISDYKTCILKINNNNQNIYNTEVIINKIEENLDSWNDYSIDNVILGSEIKKDIFEKIEFILEFNESENVKINIDYS